MNRANTVKTIRASGLASGGSGQVAPHPPMTTLLLLYPQDEETVMYAPTGVVHQAQINQAAAQVGHELAPWVRYIRYAVEPDWSGRWAVFFRVVLADEVSSGNALRDITTRVVWRMSELLNLPDLGLFPYFDFRSESEQAALNEPGWRAAG